MESITIKLCKCGQKTANPNDVPKGSSLRVLTEFMCMDCILNKIQDNTYDRPEGKGRGRPRKLYTLDDYWAVLDKAVHTMSRTHLHEIWHDHMGEKVILRKFVDKNKKPPKPETLIRVMQRS